MLYKSKIRDLLATNKMSIEDLAEKMHLSRNGLQRKLADQSDLYVSELVFIAQYFNVNPEFFFNDIVTNDKTEQDIDRIFDALKVVVKEKIIKK